MHNNLTDADLERNDWYIVTEIYTIPPIGMYENMQKIFFRIITGVKPQ